MSACLCLFPKKLDIHPKFADRQREYKILRETFVIFETFETLCFSGVAVWIFRIFRTYFPKVSKYPFVLPVRSRRSSSTSSGKPFTGADYVRCTEEAEARVPAIKASLGL